MWTIDRVINELNKLAAADGLGYIKVPVTVNARLTSTLGRVKYIRIGGDTYIAKAIEFSKHLLETGTDNDIMNVIKHEYVHYFLVETTNVNHGHDRVFKDKCKAIGCEHTKTHNALENEGKFKYEVWCDNCGLIATYSRMGKTLKNLDSCSCSGCHESNLKMIQNW
jgi:predicted SprT family Zn-dependent metalloprotease